MMPEMHRKGPAPRPSRPRHGSWSDREGAGEWWLTQILIAGAALLTAVWIRVLEFALEALLP